MGKFENNYISDPFTSLLDTVIDDATHIAANTSKLPHERKCFQELKAFQYFYDSAQGDRPFAYAVNLMPSLTVTLENVIAHFERYITKNRKTVKPNREEIKALRNDFEELKTIASSFTPSHIALEAHFYGWVVVPTFWLTNVDEKIYEFFEPLTMLRDDYISSSKPELLAEYLAMVERLAIDPFYLEFLAADRSRFASKQVVDVESLFAELETFVLMRELG